MPEQLESRLEQLNDWCARTSGLPEFAYWREQRMSALRSIALYRPLSAVEYMNLGHQYPEAKRLAGEEN